MVNKDLLERVKPITVDYVETPMGAGFHISSSLKADKSCGSCSC
jgi:Fe-S cluster assembly iron-binding protein IscA